MEVMYCCHLVDKHLTGWVLRVLKLQVMRGQLGRNMLKSGGGGGGGWQELNCKIKCGSFKMETDQFEKIKPTSWFNITFFFMEKKSLKVEKERQPTRCSDGPDGRRSVGRCDSVRPGGAASHYTRRICSILCFQTFEPMLLCRRLLMGRFRHCRPC